MARRRCATLLWLYVALLAAFSVLLWLALVSWSPAPLPAANAHGVPAPPRHPVPRVTQGVPWWQGPAEGVAGADAAGVVGVLAGVVVEVRRERETERRPPAA